MGMVMRTGTSYHTMINSAAAAPFSGSISSSSPAYNYSLSSADAPHLPLVDDLLDFSDHDLIPSHGGANTMATATTNSHYILPAVEPCSVARSLPASGDQMISASLSDFQSQQSSFDLYIPCEEAAELEWLSQFVDDSFSDIPNYQSVGLIPPSGTQGQLGRADQSAVATARGARSKRSRATPGSTSAATWTSSLLTPAAQSSPSSPSSSSSSEFPSFQTKPNGCTTANKNCSSRGKNGSGADHFGMDGGAVRRCTHCASEKTPQWRTGPLGPKTLCNACGVRYKSGRLVPEYRPAASPTFVLTQHSNSHRKVMELRRQKEMLILSNTSAASSAAGASRQDLLFSDHQHHYGVC